VKKKLNIGVVIPRSRTSMLVGVEYSGRDSVSIHGKPRELNLFVLKSETSDWQLWLDDDYKWCEWSSPTCRPRSCGLELESKDR